MTESLTIQGRCLSAAQLQDLRHWVEENPRWSRWRLSRELATRWDWRNGAGVLKDMAARTLLVKLAHRGLICLPERRQVPTNRMRCGPPPTLEWAEPDQPVTGALAQLEPLTRMLHKPVEQMGGRGVRKLENSELYDNQLRRPEPNRL